LGHYEQAFRENDIDVEVLPELTADDLIGLGVASIGHRRKLLAALAALRKDTTSAGSPSAQAESAPAAGGRSPVTRPLEAERRQLTVMLVDLVGSTALSARLDPEELRQVLRAYQDAVAGAVVRYEGHVAKFMGDGVLAYFGWPQAHEDDAERAVRAALAVVDNVGRLHASAGEPLATRIGIATGLVVVGDLLGEGAAREETVVGETPNLAARLQALARPDQVVIAPSTRQLVGQLFQLEALAPTMLKGLEAPVAAFRVLAEGRAESRFEARHGGTVAPLIGREHELELLLGRWRQARPGEGQVVLLAGEPGIGKSRLVEALREATRGDGRAGLRYQTSPHHTNSALWPVIRQLERAAGLERDDAPEVRLDKLEALLARAVPDSRGPAALLAPLLGLDGSTRYPAEDLTPQQRKARTLQALVDQLEGLARREPVLVVLEDLHWLDPTTRELFDLVVDRLQRLPVLLAATFRPELPPPWMGFPHVTLLTLNRLARHEAAALIDAVTGGRALPAVVAETILERTEGVPLFVEELTKAVLDSGLPRATEGGHELGSLPPPLAIPSTLQDSLVARLDRLASAKPVAQVGAAIGREFSFKLLAAVADLGEEALEGALEELVGSGLAFRRGSPPEASYTFKHALVQDAAYRSLLRSRRQQLHARIADALEREFPGLVDAEPEVLAHHCTQAGLTERAVEYWSRAGDLAIRRSANEEAVGHLGRGLACLEGLPESGDRDRRELALRNAVGGPLIAIRGYAAPEVGETYGRARVLCECLGETAPLFAALSGEFVYHFVRGDHRMMRRLADETWRLSERSADPAISLAGHRLSAITAMQAGAFAEARAEFERILRLYDPDRHRPPPVHYVHDPKISALSYLPLILWLLGYPEEARRASGAAFRCAEEMNQANLIGHVRMFAGAALHELLRDTRAVREHAEAMIDLSRRHGLRMWLLNGLIFQGWALAQEGAGEEGVALMRRNASERSGLGVGWYQTRYLCLLAETYLGLRQAEAGLGVIAQAKELMARNEDRMWQAEVARIEGELLRQGGQSDAAEACFALALATARRQDAKSLELRAATSLARAWIGQGKRPEARDLLGSIHGWFTEGLDTADLQEAGALLCQPTSSPLRSRARPRCRSAS
jgi:predicted ATPase/class 3 adenylate cyclase